MPGLKVIALSLSAAFHRTRTSSIRGRLLAILSRGRWGRVSLGDDDEPFPDSWPVISAGEARFDTGLPGKVYGAPGEYMLGS
jgi:hypothetical protein